MVEAIVDTGADGTLIPFDILESIGATYIDRAYLWGVTGQRELIDVFLITVHLGELRFPGVRAAAISTGKPAILGRDVLNQLQMTLLGPAGSIEVTD